MATLIPIPVVLDRKEPHRGHIVVGDELLHQAGFLAEFLGQSSVTPCQMIDDAMLLNRLSTPGDPFVLLADHERDVKVSADVRTKVGLWGTAPVKKDSAAVHALVRYAAMSVLKEEEPDKDVLRNVGAAVVKQCGEDGSLQGMLWTAAWTLTDLKEIVGEGWKQPWERPWGWVVPKEPMPKRLHSLYKDLGGWVFARDDNRRGAERLGVSPARFQALRAINLSVSKVDAALCVLSAWRAAPDDGYSTALKISTIFGKER